MSDNTDRIREWIPKFKESITEETIERLVGQIDPTPMAEDTKEINTKVFWEKAFYDLIFEILDFDLGFTNAKSNFTNALLNAGSQYNPQGVYQLFDLVTTRLERIHIVKRICNFLGLHGEMEKILEHEMELIYKTPRYNMPRAYDLTNPVAGESEERSGPI